VVGPRAGTAARLLPAAQPVGVSALDVPRRCRSMGGMDSISVAHAGDKEMSPKTWFGLTLFWGSLLVLCWPLIAADERSDSDVDLTVRVERKGFTNSIGMRFVPVGAGTFVMGSPEDEKEREPFG